MSTIISILSGKGGAGKTTISAGLGCVYSALGFKVLIVDLDMGLRNLDLHFQVQEDIVFDLWHVLQGVTPLMEAAVEIPGYPSLSILASSLQKGFEELKLEDFKGLLAQAKDNFDIILLDAPAGAHPELISLVQESQTVLLVSHPYQTGFRSIDKVLGVLEHQDVYWLINRIPRQRGIKDLITSKIQEVNFPLIGMIYDHPKLLSLHLREKPISHRHCLSFIKALEPIAFKLTHDGESPFEPCPKTLLDKIIDYAQGT
jgi:septum site-determining protein MinD